MSPAANVVVVVLVVVTIVVIIVVAVVVYVVHVAVGHSCSCCRHCHRRRRRRICGPLQNLSFSEKPMSRSAFYGFLVTWPNDKTPTDNHRPALVPVTKHHLEKIFTLPNPGETL